jgi:ABC-type lipopolysaccharide export system ATPase subunit
MDIFRTRHEQRIKSDIGFNYLIQERDVLSEIRKEEYVSLNLKKRKAEWEKRKQAKKERKNRFFASVGIKPADDGEGDIINVKRRNAVETDQKVIQKIGVKEAARILSDYITIKVPRAAMHDAAR